MNRNAKFIQTKSRNHEVAQTGQQTYTVTSGTSGNVYTVFVGPENVAHCSCTWGQYRKAGAGSGCSHVVAVQERMAEQQGRRVSAWASEDAAKRQHRPVVNIQDGIILTTRRA